MGERHLIIIGGGLAGLSAGCYGLRNGFRATVIEHGATLGGVCTAWSRDRYTVDGCIHWLTGGPFARLYEELGILPDVELRTLDAWTRYRDVSDGLEVSFTRDLDALVADLSAVSPADREELERLRQGARAFGGMSPPLDAPELSSLHALASSYWDMRGAVGPMLHFRQSIGEWADRHLHSPRLRRIFTHVLPETAPAFFLLMVLGYLEAGHLSRPLGGSRAFAAALERAYLRAGGEVRTSATVEEVLVERGRAVGVRLGDGTMVHGDLVLSTASAPETVVRLLGARYDADATRERMERWRMFDPIVLVSFGVERAYQELPALLTLDHVGPLRVGGRDSDYAYLRICNDDPKLAPPGHSVVQLMARADYAWWATRGSGYHAEQDALAEHVLDVLEPHLPGLRGAVRMTDVATPLSYWNMARSWRGAYEGWMPTPENFFVHPKKTLAGLSGFYMAGQWVEPGGGVPTAVMSGRQAIQLACRDDGRAFRGVAT